MNGLPDSPAWRRAWLIAEAIKAGRDDAAALALALKAEPFIAEGLKRHDKPALDRTARNHVPGDWVAEGGRALVDAAPAPKPAPTLAAALEASSAKKHRGQAGLRPWSNVSKVLAAIQALVDAGDLANNAAVRDRTGLTAKQITPVIRDLRRRGLIRVVGARKQASYETIRDARPIADGHGEVIKVAVVPAPPADPPPPPPAKPRLIDARPVDPAHPPIPVTHCPETGSGPLPHYDETAELSRRSAATQAAKQARRRAIVARATGAGQ